MLELRAIAGAKLATIILIVAIYACPLLVVASQPVLPARDPCALSRSTTFTIDTAILPAEIAIRGNATADPEIINNSEAFLVIQTWGFQYKFNFREKYFRENESDDWKEGYGLLTALHVSNLINIPDHSGSDERGVHVKKFKILAEFGGSKIQIPAEMKETIGASPCTNAHTQSSETPTSPTFWARLLFMIKGWLAS